MEEFARVVGAQPPEIAAWLNGLLYDKVILPKQYSVWTRGIEPIAEAFVRIYVTQRQGRWVAPAPKPKAVKVRTKPPKPRRVAG